MSGCTWLTDVTALAGLTNLTSLNLRGCESVSDLKPLEKLTNLTSLDLGGCSSVSELKPLEKLTKLTFLDLGWCRAKEFRPIRSLLDTLTSLRVRGSQFLDLHPAVCGERYPDNAIERVREYFKALDSGKQPDADIKVFVLGNGGAGKTSLVMRLTGKSPTEVERAAPPSTHGVLIETHPAPKEWTLPHPVQFCFWDFGGQDVYHGTHALFLRGPALYLLLYSHATENDAILPQGGGPIRNRRPPYWFDYLQQEAGTDGVVTDPVLLAQSRCDEPPGLDKAPPHEPAPGRFTQLSPVVPVSAVTDRGLRHLYIQLEDALNAFLEERPRPPLPTSWVKVRQAIHTLRTKGTRVLT